MEKLLANFQYKGIANIDKTMLGDQEHSTEPKQAVSCLTKVFYIKVTMASWTHQLIYPGPLFYQVVQNCEHANKIK